MSETNRKSYSKPSDPHPGLKPHMDHRLIRQILILQIQKKNLNYTIIKDYISKSTFRCVDMSCATFLSSDSLIDFQNKLNKLLWIKNK